MYGVMQKHGINSLICHLAIGKFFSLSHPIQIRHNTFLPREFKASPHIHDYPQIWYCNSGEYIHFTKTGKHICRKGSLVIIPPGCPDDFAVPEGQQALLTNINIDLSFFKNVSFSQFPNTISNLFLPNFSDLLGHEFKDFITLDNNGIMKFRQLAEAITLATSDDSDCAKQNYLPILNLLESLLSSEPFRLPEKYLQKASELSEAKIFPIIQTIIYINNNFSKKLTSSKCAEISMLCKTNFFKAFHSFTGAPFSEYLKQLRVVHVSILLGNSPFSLTYIANLCGYSDAAYMSNCVKKYTGRIPKVRKQRMQDYYKQLHSENPQHKSLEQIIEAYTE